MSAMIEELEKEMGQVRHNWNIEEITALYEMPFNDLLFEAQKTHRENFDPNAEKENLQRHPVAASPERGSGRKSDG